MTIGLHIASGERSISRTSESPKAVKIVEMTGELPPMPRIAAQLFERLWDDHSTPREIYQLIIRDQALAARVLKVANSPYYGASRSIATLQDAVMFLGFDSIRSLIMTAVLKGMFANVGHPERLLWEHALGCGLIFPKNSRRSWLRARRRGLPHRAYARRWQSGALLSISSGNAGNYAGSL